MNPLLLTDLENLVRCGGICLPEKVASLAIHADIEEDPYAFGRMCSILLHQNCLTDNLIKKFLSIAQIESACYVSNCLTYAPPYFFENPEVYSWITSIELCPGNGIVLMQLYHALKKYHGLSNKCRDLFIYLREYVENTFSIIQK